MIGQGPLPVAFLLAALASGAAPSSAAAATPAAPASATHASVEIAPHRATYTLRLKSLAPDAHVAGASGAVAFEWADACEGWAVNQIYLLRVSEASGGESAIKDSYSSWEAKDGSRYRFSVTRGRDGELVERVGGEARLSPGEGGEAVFTDPDATTLSLPKGTVFPSAHSLALIDAAQAGARFAQHVVFDGSDTSGVQDVSATILPPVPPAPGRDFPGGLAPHQAWPMFLAFFTAGARDGEPDFELAVYLQANGVATRITLDFGAFVMEGDLETLEALPKSGC